LMIMGEWLKDCLFKERGQKFHGFFPGLKNEFP